MSFFPLNFERLAATLSRGILTDPFGCPDANSPGVRTSTKNGYLAINSDKSTEGAGLNNDFKKLNIFIN